MEHLDLVATSTFGLEAVVAREVRELGYDTTHVENARVHFAGDTAAIARANLWRRSSDRVLIRMGEFAARDFGELFDRTAALPWERWIRRDATFPVTGRSRKSQLSSVPACQKIVKKAVVERLKQAYGVEWFEERGPTCKVEVALLDDRATLTLDTTGPGLHKRGYRKLRGAAPLKETLAAAMVQLSFWRPDRPLIDPFCGTGTIPIEAALLGRNIAPGLNREFVAEGWPSMDAAVWAEARAAARDAVKPDLPARIIGTDIDDKVLDLARYHAQQAGVAEDIHFQQRDFADLRAKRDYGCLICNPPYGERMGERDEIAALYRAMPDVLRRLKTWSHFILTAHPDFETLVGQPADKRRKLYNGRIECTFYQFHGPRPPREERPPVPQIPTSDFRPSTSPPPETRRKPAFGGLPDATARQAEDFANRLRKRARHLRKWPSRGIACYRLYERDIPEIPLVIDRYQDCLHVAEYERPHEHTAAEHGEWIEHLLDVAAEALEVERGNVFLKRRDRQRGLTQHERIAEQGAKRIVTEGGLKFEINLSDYVDTGLFLDHRQTRQVVREEARGKRFLNLFAYTGAFSVYAAAGGAVSTTTVDHSNTYLDWSRRNLELNGFTGRQHRLVRNDILTFLNGHAAGEHYDLAVMDPPTYSNRKDYEQDWEVQRDYAAALSRLLELMAPGGVVFFSTNFRRFKMDEQQITGPAGAAVAIREISRQTVPEDFRNRRIHRCWRIEKKATGGNSNDEIRMTK